MEAELEAIKTRPLSAGFGKKSVSRFPSNNSRAASIDNNGKLSATLERKNKQLNQATKQLEEKVKSLKEKTTKQRSLPKVAKEKQQPPRASSAPPRELPGVPAKLALEKGRRGSTVTSRIREREAEFQKQVKEREDQIGQLKDRLKLLSQKLSESKEKDFKFPRDREKVVRDQREDGAELQNIIKQVTKERLQLERHLQIANDSLQRNNGFDLSKYITLEQSNQYLRQQLDSLDLLQQEHKLVEIQYREKEEACRYIYILI
jgi:DNA repair exonuclease SbcCD ATPase subunit